MNEKHIIGELVALRVINQKLLDVVIGMCNPEDEAKFIEQLSVNLKTGVDGYIIENDDDHEIKDRAKSAIDGFLKAFK